MESEPKSKNKVLVMNDLRGVCSVNKTDSDNDESMCERFGLSSKE